MLDLYSRFFAKLSYSEVRYCVWKSVHDVDNGLVGLNDLDILVDPLQSQLFVKIATELGFVRNDAIPSRHYRFVEDYFGLDEQTGTIVKFQFYRRVIIGSLFAKQYSPALESVIMQSRVKQPGTGVWLIEEALDYELNAVRLALKIRARDHFLKLFGKDVVTQRFSREKVQYKLITPDVINSSTACAELHRLLISESPPTTNFVSWVAFQSHLRKIFKRFQAASGAQIFVQRHLREISRVLRKLVQSIDSLTILEHRTFKNRGLVVVFLGQDGAGKSTTLALVSKNYRSHFDVEEIYLGSGDGKSSLIRFPMLWLYKRLVKLGIVKTRAHQVDGSSSASLPLKVDTEASNSGGGSSGKHLVSDAVRLFWIFLVSRERRAKYRKLCRSLAAGKLVLADRMPQLQIPDGPDTLRTPRIRTLSRFGVLGQMVMSYERRTIEQFEALDPGLVIKLLVEPEEAVRRKPHEVTVAYSTRSRQKIESLQIGKQTIEIDNTSNFADNERQIKIAIWHA